MKTILITGSAGFIGFHLARHFLSKGYRVLGIDAMTDHYDVSLKNKRNELLKQNKNYIFKQGYIEDYSFVLEALLGESCEIVVHLAAQAGVRYSAERPSEFLNSNLIGTFNLIDIVKDTNCKHLLVASSSSVYGNQDNVPFKETSESSLPLSFYAATKKSNEVMTYAYSNLYKLPTTCFRFFTIYGPWGRPDMALFKFTESILKGKSIEVFNKGEMYRDFTYIDDLIESIIRLVSLPPEAKKRNGQVNRNLNAVPWRVVNIGNSKPVYLKDFISTIEKELGIKAKKIYRKMHLGDAHTTFSDSSYLYNLINFKPQTDIQTGVANFIDWYKSYVLA